MATQYVEGLRQAVKSLEDIGADVQEMKDVFTDIGLMVAQDASRLAPKKSGRMAASLKPTKTKNKAAVRGGGARAPYIGAINYGWPRRGIRQTLFLQRAIDQNEAKAIQMMEDGIGEIINRYQ